MSKANWFEHYERLEAEHPTWTDDQLSDGALEAQRDQMADRVDQMKDQKMEQDACSD